jgi:phosphoribosyl 1,2-cyclic phosphodiesterase
LGFSFGQEGEFVYISDVKVIPDKSMEYLLSFKIKTLVIDCLDLHDGIFPHMGLNDCLDIIEKLNPEVCYLTGMCCDVGFHEVANEAIRNRSPRTSLSFDGMYIAGMSM